MPSHWVDCECGNAMKIPESESGKRLRCRKCGAAFLVPMAEPDPDDPVAMIEADQERKWAEVQSPVPIEASMPEESHAKPVRHKRIPAHPRPMLSDLPWSTIGGVVIGATFMAGVNAINALNTPPVVIAKPADPPPVVAKARVAVGEDSSVGAEYNPFMLAARATGIDEKTIYAACKRASLETINSSGGVMPSTLAAGIAEIGSRSATLNLPFNIDSFLGIIVSSERVSHVSFWEMMQRATVNLDKMKAEYHR